MTLPIYDLEKINLVEMLQEKWETLYAVKSRFVFVFVFFKI